AHPRRPRRRRGLALREEQRVARGRARASGQELPRRDARVHPAARRSARLGHRHPRPGRQSPRRRRTLHPTGQTRAELNPMADKKDAATTEKKAGEEAAPKKSKKPLFLGGGALVLVALAYVFS